MGSILGGGPSQNNNMNQANNLLNSNAQTGATQANNAFSNAQNILGQANNMFSQGTNWLNSAQPNFNQAGQAFSKPMDFYSALLSGDQGKAMSVLSPQIQQINQANENQRRAAATFSPMGGGRSGQMASMPFQRESQVSNLYSSLLPGAAQGLTGIGAGLTGLGGAQGGLGVGLTNAGVGQTGQGVGMTNAGGNLLSGSSSAANDMYRNALQRQQMQNQSGGMLGGGLGSLLGMGLNMIAPGSGTLLGGLGGILGSAMGGNNPFTGTGGGDMFG